ncbi:hypothetical protein C488_01709 [Natrinema pellirubrum DSM 15624]|uniref:Uncharacterized protein n=1 Tax=Natrinema pellirubrum (strain DSM 15624 / CIP 106293 / JCM 10476 / NCIMB 786 / 157) TaxID=797303 RepID=L0JKN9_NATP1|nr:hypothetical protein [Natrinema pellirubrum]AGB31152.1 hypothetical protein Natpe_1247 [Natrinema pellirubrum DSM 15624]ELY81484.1 hypothetical protein C488_01709 [Natrinema pellirubrum DSM 15624]
MTGETTDPAGPTGTGRSGSGLSTRRLLAILFREEWRMHTELFGGWRFALFPFVIAALAVGGSVALVETGTAPGTVVVGLHVLAAGFGLYSGTAGFAGSDMLENVFGRLSLLLSSSTTLPLSRRRLLGVFLLKDALFYGVAFVLPMALGGAVAEGLSATTPLSLVAFWASLFLVFAVGMATTVALIAVRTRGVPPWTIGLAVGLTAVAGWALEAGAALRSVVVPIAGSALSAGGLAAATLVVAAGSLLLYDPTYGRPSRTATDRFARLSAALPVADSPLVTKSLLDLARSSGGVWKPFVSSTILLALVAALVGVVDSITGVAPAPGIFFGGVLGLSAFTTYNWLTQFDSLEAYLAYPVSIADVFRAKRTAFVLVGAPTAALPYLAAVVWFDATPLDAVVGAILLAGYALYYYGLTVFIAGFDPNEFLFDAVRFATFTVGVAVALVPTLVAGFVVVPPSLELAAVLVLGGLVMGAVGIVLSSRAGPRWDARYRTE